MTCRTYYDWLIGQFTKVVAGINDVSNVLPQMDYNLQKLYQNTLIPPMRNHYFFGLGISHARFINPAVCVQRVYC